MSWFRALPDPAAVTVPPGWTLDWVATIGSTNDALARQLPAGEVRVLAAQEQTAGRGRAGRDWQCPPGAGLMFSIRLSLAGVPAARRGWVGAVLGLAVVEALPVRAALKWPNDVLIGDAKVAGILAEQVGDDVVVGTGINVSLTADELPRTDATSLLLAGVPEVDRAALLTAILASFAQWAQRWTAAGGEVDAAGIRPEYRRRCSTLGRTVRLELPGGKRVSGTAVDVDDAGSIVLDIAGARRAFAAGDVVHLR